MMETINEQLKMNFYTNTDIISQLKKNKKAVQNDEISPFAAASELLKLYFDKGSK